MPTPTQKTVQDDVFAKEGRPFLAVTAVLAFLAFLWSGLLAVLFLGLFGFCAYFFRNPKRAAPQDAGALISPADGTVLSIEECEEPDFLKRRMQRVTVFMSPFNVHVNRFPDAGQVLDQVYHPGKFLAAFDPKASLENERSAIHIKTGEGDDVVFVQIAGWLARRIVSYPQKGDHYKRGEIYGVIRFGSRMDIYCDHTYQVSVTPKQKIKAGETVLAQKR